MDGLRSLLSTIVIFQIKAIVSSPAESGLQINLSNKQHWIRDFLLRFLEKKKMDNLLQDIQGFRHKLTSSLSKLFYGWSSPGQTRKVFSTEMYLTSNVAFEKPGLPIQFIR